MLRQILLALSGAVAISAAPVAPPPARIAPGLFLIEGGIEKGRQPDGNSVVMAAPQGLIVIDTGRHAAHRARIAAFADARNRPIAAIVNTHWHLDHTSGNAALKRANRGARVYASRAVEGALTGFLASSAKAGREALASGKLDPVTAEEIRVDLATIQSPAALKPDVTIERSGPMIIAGRPLEVRLVKHAITEGDVWLFDPRSSTAIVGDLVTLPAPFLDTACPEGWRRALAEVEATPFVTLIPGHGGPMTRAQFAVWRTAFGALLDCVASSAPATQCADGWTKAVTPLLGADERKRQHATSMTARYIAQQLRAPGGKQKYCPA